MLIGEKSGKKLACKLTEDYESLDFSGNDLEGMDFRLKATGQPYSITQCIVCNEDMVSTGSKCVYRWCSNECRAVDKRKMAAESIKQRRAAKKQKPQSKACLVCSEEFQPTRSDSKFCSNKCRAANHRANHIPKDDKELRLKVDSLQDQVRLLELRLETANKNLRQLEHENKHLLSGTPFNEIPPLEDDSEQAKQADWTGEEPAIKDGEYDGTTPLVNVLSALIGYGKGNDPKHSKVMAKIRSDLKITSKAKRLKPAENLIRLRHVQDNLTEYRELFSNKK